FEVGPANRLIARYPVRLLEEWVDITQAAIERFGMTFFKKSPPAFLVDSLSKAHQGKRTPPDWWHEIRRGDQKQADLSMDSKRVLDQIRSELLAVSNEPESAQRSSVVPSVRNILKSVE
ncbi:MAG: hypothetical protein MI861_25385, partial [Pirellulales bacterium]|nr:hypothetical protein [Pirellulales bacterium]